MGDIIQFELPQSSLDAFKGLAPSNDLSEGVQPSFGVVSFKGKVFRVKYKGEDHIIRNKDGDPAANLVAVIVKGSPCISKIYYPGSYTEGDDSPPACFSVDGMAPDPGSENPQANTCAGCPHNVWGSKITEQGSKTKACADSRRMAIVPYPDVNNEAFGGPLLLRIPPASLQSLAAYSDALTAKGVPYQAVVTKIGFDPEAAYPRLTFQPIAAVDADKAPTIMDMIESTEVERMLASAPITGDAQTPAQAAQKAATNQPAPAPAPVPTPAASAPAEGDTAAPTTVSAGTAVPNGSATATGGSSEATPSNISAEPENREPPVEKPSAKEQNAVEADPVAGDLSSMINNFGL